MASRNQPCGAAPSEQAGQQAQSPLAHHTPGPWLTFDNREMNDAIWIGPEMFISVAEVRMGSDDVPGDLWANAHLIAAAPELLAALQALMHFEIAHVGPGSCEARELAKAALTKALPPESCAAGQSEAMIAGNSGMKKKDPTHD